MEPIKKGLNEFLTEHFAYVKTSRLDRVRSQGWDCCQLGYASSEVKCYFEDAFANGSDDDRKELFGNIRLILRRLCRDYSKLNRLPVDVSVAPVMATGYEDDVLQFADQITEDLEPIQELYEYLRKTYAVTNALPLLSTPQLKANLTDAERERLFEELTKDGAFLAQDTDKASFLWAFGGGVPLMSYVPIMWTAYNSTTQKHHLNKKALLNLLELIGVSFEQIRDRALLMALFVDPNSKPLKYSSANYSGNWSSEYNQQLTEIVESARKE